MSNFNDKLQTLLKTDSRFVDQEWDLLRNEVIDKAFKIDEKLIELLISDDEVKSKFFCEIKGHWVFNINSFVDFIQDKNFLNDSYTKYKNKIWINIGWKFLNERKEISLVRPYKDCILEWWQSKEDQKRKEIFFNETLAQDEIDRLLDPKVLTSWKKYNKDWEQKVEWFTRNNNWTIKDNLIIKGNNLLALHTLKKEFTGKIKLIYIDPPYNTGNDWFKYNDNFNHSTWLTFMKNRLEIAKELLRDDWIMFLQCDDNEQAYLKILMDEIFWRENYLNTISVKTKASSGASGWGEDKKLKKNIEYIMCYNRWGFERFNDIYEETELTKYINEMKESGTSFKYTNILYKIWDKEKYKTIKDWSWNDIIIYKVDNYEIKTVKEVSKIEWISEEETYNKYYEYVMTTTNAQTSIRDKVWEATDSENNLYSIEYFPISWRNKWQKTELLFLWKQKVLVIRLKNTAVKKGNKIFKREKIGTFWEWFSRINVQKEGNVNLNSGKKPEELLKQVIEISTNIDDIVLDFFWWSWTTWAVAHKMNRQRILIEQMNYVPNMPEERLINVINGDQSWISKAVNRQWWWEFIYCELKKYNQDFIDQIERAKDTKELLKIWEDMKSKSFLNYNVDITKQDEVIEEFKELSLDEQKKALVELLDKNQLYVNLSEINDKDFEVSEEDKQLNKIFYEL